MPWAQENMIGGKEFRYMSEAQPMHRSSLLEARTPWHEMCFSTEVHTAKGLPDDFDKTNKDSRLNVLIFSIDSTNLPVKVVYRGQEWLQTTCSFYATLIISNKTLDNYDETTQALVKMDWRKTSTMKCLLSQFVRTDILLLECFFSSCAKMMMFAESYASV